MISDLLDLAGLCCLVAAGFLIAVPLGLCVLGLALLLIGTAVSRGPSAETD